MVPGEYAEEKEAVGSELNRILVTVSPAGEVLGLATLLRTHQLPGTELHRAFSLLLVDPEGRQLIQRRSEKKKVFGGMWANACCSHHYIVNEPSDAADLLETMGRMCSQRLRYETGISLEIRPSDYVGTFEYRTHLCRDSVPGKQYSLGMRCESPTGLEEMLPKLGLSPPRCNVGYGEWELDYVFVKKVSKEELETHVHSRYNEDEVSKMRIVTMEDLEELARFKEVCPWLPHIADLFLKKNSKSSKGDPAPSISLVQMD